MGDRFILRDVSARRTIGGGRVIDPHGPARHRARPARLDLLAAMALPDPPRLRWPRRRRWRWSI